MAYYKAIVWTRPISMGVSAAVFVAFIVAAFWDTSDKSSIVSNISLAVSYSSLMAVMTFLTRYLMFAGSEDYYRWNQQDWWTEADNTFFAF